MPVPIETGVANDPVASLSSTEYVLLSGSPYVVNGTSIFVLPQNVVCAIG